MPTLSLWVTGLSLALAAPPDPALAVPVVQTPPPQALNLAAQARTQLDAASALLTQVEDEALQRRIARKLENTRALLLQIEGLPGGVGVVVPTRDAVVVVGGGRVADRPSAAGRRLRPLSDAEFDDLAAEVADTAFSSQQLKALRTGTRDRGVTVRQVMELMGLFSCGRDQVEAAAMLHDHVVDPDRWSLVYGVFKFTSDAEALRARVE